MLRSFYHFVLQKFQVTRLLIIFLFIFPTLHYSKCGLWTSRSPWELAGHVEAQGPRDLLNQNLHFCENLPPNRARSDSWESFHMGNTIWQVAKNKLSFDRQTTELPPRATIEMEFHYELKWSGPATLKQHSQEEIRQGPVGIRALGEVS